MITLNVGQAVDVPAGEFEFEFNCPTDTTQYALDTNVRGSQISAYQNGKGFAVSKPDTWYLHSTLPKGKIRFTIFANTKNVPVDHPYKVVLRKRSWWEKVFG